MEHNSKVNDANPVNEDDAPLGHKAIIATMLCGKCKFIKKDCVNMPWLNCCPSQRDDGRMVIFVKDVNE